MLVRPLLTEAPLKGGGGRRIEEEREGLWAGVPVFYPGHDVDNAGDAGN